MAYRVMWTKSAKHQRKEALLYGAKVWGNDAARKFRNQLIKEQSLLSAHPNMGKTEPLLETFTKNYRSLVVHKHFKLVYYIDERQQTLFIVALWDTRREPGAMSQSIRDK